MATYLDKLELHGFKSFPEKTVIKFHRGITAVVGPNGCGKSNIVDSILWVMGEQRIKNLRGENNEDLIFKGSSTKKPLGMTEVGAFFCNDSEDIYMARRFFRSGESKYILNERFCRNKDIQDVLFKLRLGGTNYFIFEQGSIEKLITLKPTEKRMLIEEAADISKYLLRKKETANKLIISQQNLDNLQILLSEKESRLKELRNQVNYVQRYRKIKNEKIENLKTYLRRKYEIYQKEFKKTQSELEKIINVETIEVKEIAAIEKEILKLEENRWNVDKSLKHNQQQIFEYNKNIISGKNEIQQSKQRRGFMANKIKEIEAATISNEKELVDIEKDLSSSGSAINSLDIKLKQETSGYKEIEIKLDDLNSKIEHSNADNASIKDEIFDLQSKLSVVNNQLNEIARQKSKIDNQIETKKIFITQLKDQIPLTEIQSQESKFLTLGNNLKEKENHFKKTEKLYLDQQNIIEINENNLKNFGHEIINLEKQREKYLQIKAKLVGDEATEVSFAHDGCLQELIQTDKKNHQILENFYFNEMDALILASGGDILNKNFNKVLLNVAKKDLPSKICHSIEKETGFLAWVRDLYTVKGGTLKGYFRNGVHVDNLKNGIALFLKYHVDVVTDEAEVITQEGLLIKNREKGILDILDEIREIDKKKAALIGKSNTLKVNHDKDLLGLEKIKKDLSKERAELDSFEKEKMQLESSLGTLKKNREANFKRIKFLESELDLLGAEEHKLNEQHVAVNNNHAELEQKHKKYQAKQKQFLGELESVKEKISSIEKNHIHKENAINLVKEKISSINFNVTNLKTRKEKLRKSIKTNQLEIEQLNKDMSGLVKQEALSDKSIAQLERNKNQVENDVKAAEKEFGKLNSEIKERSVDLTVRRKKLEELKEGRKDGEITISSIKKDLFQLEDVSFKELNCELDKIEAVQELSGVAMQDLEDSVEQVNERLIKMRDSNKLNFSAESEFELISKDFEFLLSQKEDVVKSIENMNDAIKKIDEESTVSFLQAFDKIKENFKKNFQILFEGGEAELSLMEPDNILETGLEIKAQPPGKRLLSLKLLSGGEKTLTALAFLFALFEYKPSPFCVFDEVDASLDEANIKRFLNFLHKLKQKTQ